MRLGLTWLGSWQGLPADASDSTFKTNTTDSWDSQVSGGWKTPGRIHNYLRSGAAQRGTAQLGIASLISFLLKIELRSHCSEALSRHRRGGNQYLGKTKPKWQSFWDWQQWQEEKKIEKWNELSRRGFDTVFSDPLPIGWSRDAAAIALNDGVAQSTCFGRDESWSLKKKKKGKAGATTTASFRLSFPLLGTTFKEADVKRWNTKTTTTMQPRGNQSSLRSQPTVTQPEERKGKGVNGRVSGLLLLGKNPFTRTQTPPTTAF